MAERGGGAYLGWFLFGATLGALAGLLLSPRTGEENRGLLGDLAADAQDRAGEWLDKSREIFEEQTQRLMGAFEAGRDAMRDEIKKTPPLG
jgi:gas vesicle protein